MLVGKKLVTIQEPSTTKTALDNFINVSVASAPNLLASAQKLVRNETRHQVTNEKQVWCAHPLTSTPHSCSCAHCSCSSPHRSPPSDAQENLANARVTLTMEPSAVYAMLPGCEPSIRLEPTALPPHPLDR